MLERLARVVPASAWIVLALVLIAPIACFLVLAVSPRLFDQGPQWFTLANFKLALSGGTLVSLLNSLWVSAAAAVLALTVGFPIAWLANRTRLPGRRLVTASMWLVLLLPSWLPALGWQRLVQPGGIMDRAGIHLPLVQHAVFGPAGVVLLLGLKGVPFSYLAVTAALWGLGQEFEDAARVHGAGRLATLRIVAPIIAPAIWSALAICFAESISDFGVAATLALSSHFSLATYQLYAAISNFPPNFGEAAAVGWLLVAAVVIPLTFQTRALRGRSYQVLSGRTRPVNRRSMSPLGNLAALSGIGLFVFLALGVPAIGAISGSLLADYGATFSLTLVNYKEVFTNSGLTAPLELSLVLGLITATVTVVGGFAAARLLAAKHRSRASRALDFLLLAAVALPGIVFAAGYIFAYNLPFLSKIGVDIYGTTTLLVIGYVAGNLPTNSRVLVGSVTQAQSSLTDAARTHGASGARAWLRGVLPVLSRPILMAWLLTFCGVYLELPISQLLYSPGSPPVAVAINDNLGNYHFGVGMAQSVVAVGIALIAVAVVLGGYRILAPQGWRRLGGETHG